MTIAFNCSACGAPLKLGDDLAGKKCKCPKCGAVNSVPEDGEDDAGAGPAKKDTARIAAGPGGKKKPDTDEGGAFDDLGAGKKGKGKKAGAKKGGGMKWLLIGGGALLLGGGLLTCLCAGGGFSLWMWFPEYVPSALGGWPGEMRYLPTGTSHLSFHRVDQERSSKYWKEVDAAKPSQLKDLEKNAKIHGISVSKVDCVLEGGSGSSSVTVITTKSAVTSADIRAEMKTGPGAMDFDDEKAGKYTISKPKLGGMSFCVVDSKTVLFSNDPKTLKAVLERDKMPEFTTTMQAALKKASFNRTQTMIFTGSDFKGEGPLDKRTKTEWAIIEEDVGSDKKIRYVEEFKDKEAAAAAKKEADEKILKQKGELEKKGLASEVQASVTLSGTTLTIEARESVKVGIDEVKRP
jgi:hypothetical protein